MKHDTSNDVLWFAWTFVGATNHRIALPLYAPVDWSKAMVCELAEKIYPCEMFFSVSQAPDRNSINDNS